MVGLNAHRFACSFGIHIWIPVTIATDPCPPAECRQRQWRAKTRRRGGLLKATERIVEATKQSWHEAEDRSVEVHERRTNLIEGSDAPGANTAHAPEVGHLFAQTQINLGGEGATKRASIEQGAHAAERRDQRATARLGWVGGKNGQVADLCGGGANLCRGKPRSSEVGERGVEAARTWRGGRMCARAQLCGTAALFNKDGESESQRKRAHDALDLVVLLR